MYDKLEIMRMAQSMTLHAGARQGTVAQNIANADTPGYRAQDVMPFHDAYETTSSFTMKSTRGQHFGSQDNSSIYASTIVDSDGAESPNGNTVSLEGEMVKSSEIQAQHDKALAIYKSSLDIIRASIGKR
jgi:flagellar basal-body rod protein FlgB